MPFLSDAQIFQLRRELEDTNAEILAWGSDGYAESLTRWSEACEKEAVRVRHSPFHVNWVGIFE